MRILLQKCFEPSVQCNLYQLTCSFDNKLLRKYTGVLQSFIKVLQLAYSKVSIERLVLSNKHPGLIFFKVSVKQLKYGSEEKGSSLCRCSILLGFIMSKKQERLRYELLSEGKITNLLGFLT